MADGKRKAAGSKDPAAYLFKSFPSEISSRAGEKTRLPHVPSRTTPPGPSFPRQKYRVFPEKVRFRRNFLTSSQNRFTLQQKKISLTKTKTILLETVTDSVKYVADLPEIETVFTKIFHYFMGSISDLVKTEKVLPETFTNFSRLFQFCPKLERFCQKLLLIHTICCRFESKLKQIP